MVNNQAISGLLDKYRSLIFDCDGVVLNSNHVKTESFYRAALPYGEAAAQALVDYHIARGGISRYQKFAHFLEHIVAPNQSGPDLEELLKSFADYVRQGLTCCEVAPGLDALREQTAHARWLIVSGGDQTELREVFSERGLAQLVDGGIFGSPDSKETILSRELTNGNIQRPALFLGDSRYDHQAATQAELDFVFVSNWSEVSHWPAWTAAGGIATCQQIQDLLALDR